MSIYFYLLQITSVELLGYVDLFTEALLGAVFCSIAVLCAKEQAQIFATKSKGPIFSGVFKAA